MSSDSSHALRMPPRASSFRTNSLPSAPPATVATAGNRTYGDKFRKPAAAAIAPVSISSFAEFPSLRKTTAATAAATAATAANQVVTPATSWAKTAKAAHDKELAQLEKERVAEAERLAEEEKERIRTTIHRVGIHSLRASLMPDNKRDCHEDQWTEEEEEEDEEGMGYVHNKYTEDTYGGGYVPNKYSEGGGYVANKYKEDTYGGGTPPYSPFDQTEVSQGIVENDD